MVEVEQPLERPVHQRGEKARVRLRKAGLRLLEAEVGIGAAVGHIRQHRERQAPAHS